MWIADNDLIPVFKLSRRLNKITGLQITDPKLNGRERQISNIVAADRVHGAETLQVWFLLFVKCKNILALQTTNI